MSEQPHRNTVSDSNSTCGGELKGIARHHTCHESLHEKSTAAHCPTGHPCVVHTYHHLVVHGRGMEPEDPHPCLQAQKLHLLLPPKTTNILTLQNLTGGLQADTERQHMCQYPGIDIHKFSVSYACSTTLGSA